MSIEHGAQQGRSGAWSAEQEDDPDLAPARARQDTVAVAAALAVPAAEARAPLTGDEIRELVTGNTLRGAWYAQQLTVAMHPDGLLIGTLGLSGSDRGRWRIDGDLWCQHWVRYFGAEERCYRWVPDGNGYYAGNVDNFRTYGFRGQVTKGIPPGF